VADSPIKTKLQPHQERVLEKLKRSGGVIVAHQVGSGKTLTSIAAAARSPRTEVLAPAPLVENFKKELALHTDGSVRPNIRSYQKAVYDAEKKGVPVDTSGLLILDEAHRLRNQGTSMHKHVAMPARNAAQRLLLTGTPIYNQMEDIAPLANIAAGRAILPENPTDFRKRFIKEEVVNPGFFGRLRGVEPGVKKSLQNSRDLENALAGRIDIHEGVTKDFPGISSRTVNVPMSKRQLDVYNWHLGQLPSSVAYKIKHGLPPSKQEAKSLNTFMIGVRQSSLSPRPYVASMTDDEEREHTPKIQAAASTVAERLKNNPNFRGVVYSNFLEAGLNPYSRRLKELGVPHHVFTGQSSKKEKAQMVRDYNEGRVPVLMVSSAGTEGLDLKGTRLIQVMDPHFNNSKIEQVIGRGRRYRSHAHLPEEERHVEVEKYHSAIPQGRLAKFFGKKPQGSAEEYLSQLAQEKEELANQFREALRRAHERTDPA
jgi:SNF2 family DNA or RNA helicase